MKKPRKLSVDERRTLLWVQNLVLLHVRDLAAARELTTGEALGGHYNAKIEALKKFAAEIESVADGIEPMRRT